MIQYIEDTNKTYDDAIKKILRGHNAKYSNNKLSVERYVYKANAAFFYGGLYSHYFWDWVSISDVIYDSAETIKHLMLEVIKLYNNKAVGIKTFTLVKAISDDLVEAGFVLNKSYRVGKTTYYNLEYMFDREINSDPLVYHSDEKDTRYKGQLERFKQKHNLNEDPTPYDVVALKDNLCVGGVLAQCYEDVIYVSHLAVSKDYRLLSIGRTLMHKVAEHAKKNGYDSIMLGTTSFQAKGFYEKLGYKVVFERNNCPKNSISYTMVLELV